MQVGPLLLSGTGFGSCTARSLTGTINGTSQTSEKLEGLDKSKVENQEWKPIHTGTQSNRRTLSTGKSNQGVVEERIRGNHCC